jgi:hypothetical protein
MKLVYGAKSFCFDFLVIYTILQQRHYNLPLIMNLVKTGSLTSWDFKNIPVRFLGTRFTNTIFCVEPGPPRPLQGYFLKHLFQQNTQIMHSVLPMMSSCGF